MRKAQAARAIQLLKPVKFKQIQQSQALTVNGRQIDALCVICTCEFEPEDEVTELECDTRHIFHKECLLPWLEKRLSCPTCRTDVNID